MSKKVLTYEMVEKEAKKMHKQTIKFTSQKNKDKTYTFKEVCELGEIAFINGALFVNNYRHE